MAFAEREIERWEDDFDLDSRHSSRGDNGRSEGSETTKHIRIRSPAIPSASSLSFISASTLNQIVASLREMLHIVDGQPSTEIGAVSSHESAQETLFSDRFVYELSAYTTSAIYELASDTDLAGFEDSPNDQRKGSKGSAELCDLVALLDDLRIGHGIDRTVRVLSRARAFLEKTLALSSAERRMQLSVALTVADSILAKFGTDKNLSSGNDRVNKELSFSLHLFFLSLSRPPTTPVLLTSFARLCVLCTSYLVSKDFGQEPVHLLFSVGKATINSLLLLFAPEDSQKNVRWSFRLVQGDSNHETLVMGLRHISLLLPDRNRDSFLSSPWSGPASSEGSLPPALTITLGSKPVQRPSQRDSDSDASEDWGEEFGLDTDGPEPHRRTVLAFKELLGKGSSASDTTEATSPSGKPQAPSNFDINSLLALLSGSPAAASSIIGITTNPRSKRQTEQPALISTHLNSRASENLSDAPASSTQFSRWLGSLSLSLHNCLELAGHKADDDRASKRDSTKFPTEKQSISFVCDLYRYLSTHQGKIEVSTAKRVCRALRSSASQIVHEAKHRMISCEVLNIQLSTLHVLLTCMADADLVNVWEELDFEGFTQTTLETLGAYTNDKQMEALKCVAEIFLVEARLHQSIVDGSAFTLQASSPIVSEVRRVLSLVTRNALLDRDEKLLHQSYILSILHMWEMGVSPISLEDRSISVSRTSFEDSRREESLRNTFDLYQAYHDSQTSYYRSSSVVGLSTFSGSGSGIERQTSSSDQSPPSPGAMKQRQSLLLSLRLSSGIEDDMLKLSDVSAAVQRPFLRRELLMQTFLQANKVTLARAKIGFSLALGLLKDAAYGDAEMMLYEVLFILDKLSKTYFVRANGAVSTMPASVTVIGPFLMALSMSHIAQLFCNTLQEVGKVDFAIISLEQSLEFLSLCSPEAKSIPGIRRKLAVMCSHAGDTERSIKYHKSIFADSYQAKNINEMSYVSEVLFKHNLDNGENESAVEELTNAVRCLHSIVPKLRDEMEIQYAKAKAEIFQLQLSRLLLDIGDISSAIRNLQQLLHMQESGPSNSTSAGAISAKRVALLSWLAKAFVKKGTPAEAERCLKEIRTLRQQATSNSTRSRSGSNATALGSQRHLESCLPSIFGSENNADLEPLYARCRLLYGHFSEAISHITSCILLAERKRQQNSEEYAKLLYLRGKILYSTYRASYTRAILPLTAQNLNEYSPTRSMSGPTPSSSFASNDGSQGAKPKKANFQKGRLYTSSDHLLWDAMTSFSLAYNSFSMQRNTRFMMKSALQLASLYLDHVFVGVVLLHKPLNLVSMVQKPLPSIPASSVSAVMKGQLHGSHSGDEHRSGATTTASTAPSASSYLTSSRAGYGADTTSPVSSAKGHHRRQASFEPVIETGQWKAQSSPVMSPARPESDLSGHIGGSEDFVITVEKIEDPIAVALHHFAEHGSDLLTTLACYLRYAELTMLKGDVQSAISCWDEVRRTFEAAYIDGITCPILRVSSVSFMDEVKALATGLLRFLFSCPTPVINQHLHLFDIVLLVQVEATRYQREASLPGGLGTSISFHAANATASGSSAGPASIPVYPAATTGQGNQSDHGSSLGSVPSPSSLASVREQIFDFSHAHHPHTHTAKGEMGASGGTTGGHRRNKSDASNPSLPKNQENSRSTPKHAGNPPLYPAAKVQSQEEDAQWNQTYPPKGSRGRAKSTKRPTVFGLFEMHESQKDLSQADGGQTASKESTEVDEKHGKPRKDSGKSGSNISSHSRLPCSLPITVCHSHQGMETREKLKKMTLRLWTTSLRLRALIKNKQTAITSEAPDSSYAKIKQCLLDLGETMRGIRNRQENTPDLSYNRLLADAHADITGDASAGFFNATSEGAQFLSRTVLLVNLSELIAMYSPHRGLQLIQRVSEFFELASFTQSFSSMLPSPTISPAISNSDQQVDSLKLATANLGDSGKSIGLSLSAPHSPNRWAMREALDSFGNPVGPPFELPRKLSSPSPVAIPLPSPSSSSIGASGKGLESSFATSLPRNVSSQSFDSISDQGDWTEDFEQEAHDNDTMFSNEERSRPLDSTMLPGAQALHLFITEAMAGRRDTWAGGVKGRQEFQQKSLYPMLACALQFLSFVHKCGVAIPEHDLVMQAEELIAQGSSSAAVQEKPRVKLKRFLENFISLGGSNTGGLHSSQGSSGRGIQSLLGTVGDVKSSEDLVNISASPDVERGGKLLLITSPSLAPIPWELLAGQQKHSLVRVLCLSTLRIQLIKTGSTVPRGLGAGIGQAIGPGGAVASPHGSSSPLSISASVPYMTPKYYAFSHDDTQPKAARMAEEWRKRHGLIRMFADLGLQSKHEDLYPLFAHSGTTSGAGTSGATGGGGASGASSSVLGGASLAQAQQLHQQQQQYHMHQQLPQQYRRNAALDLPMCSPLVNRSIFKVSSSRHKVIDFVDATATFSKTPALTMSWLARYISSSSSSIGAGPSFPVVILTYADLVDPAVIVYELLAYRSDTVVLFIPYGSHAAFSNSLKTQLTKVSKYFRQHSQGAFSPEKHRRQGSGGVPQHAPSPPSTIGITIHTLTTSGVNSIERVETITPTGGTHRRIPSNERNVEGHHHRGRTDSSMRSGASISTVQQQAPSGTIPDVGPFSSPSRWILPLVEEIRKELEIPVIVFNLPFAKSG